jgi:hypothetical protein
MEKKAKGGRVTKTKTRRKYKKNIIIIKFRVIFLK